MVDLKEKSREEIFREKKVPSSAKTYYNIDIKTLKPENLR